MGISLTALARLYCDNVSVTYVAAKPVQHDQIKHKVVDYHFVSEHVAHGDLIVHYIPIGSQIAWNKKK